MFGAIKLTNKLKLVNLILIKSEFDSKGTVSLPITCVNAVIFGNDMISIVEAKNKTKNVLNCL